MEQTQDLKRILITGASRGIGRATALQLAQRGHHVVLAARDAGTLATVAQQIRAAGGSASTLTIDVTRANSITAAVAQLELEGGCDVLVNNAGLCSQGEFLLQPEAAQRAEMELNYWGATRLTRALLPAFIHRGSGAVVNVSSLLATIPSSTTANYSASKAALEAFSNALRGEVSRFGVKVVVFIAPHTDTDMGRSVEFKGVRSLPVAYTAKELVRAIERTPRSYAASPVYRVLLRMARLFPLFMEARVHAGVAHLLSPDPLPKTTPHVP